MNEGEALSPVASSARSVEPGGVVLHGVSLSQYAAVQAGVGAGLPLDAVLASEGIEPATWGHAEDAWSDRILEDIEQDGPLQDAYDEHLSQAQDRVGRRVPPLDENLQAWLDFVRRWSADPEPQALLARLNLLPSDVLRLHRAWSSRIAGDPALARRAFEILRAEPGDVPDVRPEPRRTMHAEVAPAEGVPRGIPPTQNAEAEVEDEREPPLFAPLPFARHEPPTAAPVESRATSGRDSLLDVSFYRYVAAKARLAEEPGNEAALLKELGYEDFARVDSAWQARIKSDAELASDFRRLVQHEAGRIRAAKQPTEGTPAPSLAPPPEARQSPPKPRAALNLATTALALDVPRDPALPFKDPGWLLQGFAAASIGTKAPVPSARLDRDAVAPPPAPTSTPGRVPAAHPLAATMALPALTPELLARFEHGALPFKRSAEPAAPGGTVEFGALALAPTLPPTEGRAPGQGSSAEDVGVGQTAPMPALVPDGRLPFAPANAPTEPSETPPGTAEARRAPTGTASFQGVPLSAVLPFAHSAGTARLSSLGLSLPPAAVGEATSDAAKAQEGPALCTTCELTLNQYAAFCAELEVCLEDSAEIFRRYGLGSARDAVRLASQWQQRFEENAAEFEEWQRLHRLYVDECRAKGRPEVAP